MGAFQESHKGILFSVYFSVMWDLYYFAKTFKAAQLKSVFFCWDFSWFSTLNCILGALKKPCLKDSFTLEKVANCLNFVSEKHLYLL